MGTAGYWPGDATRCPIPCSCPSTSPSLDWQTLMPLEVSGPKHFRQDSGLMYQWQVWLWGRVAGGRAGRDSRWPGAEALQFSHWPPCLLRIWAASTLTARLPGCASWTGPRGPEQGAALFRSVRVSPEAVGTGLWADDEGSTAGWGLPPGLRQQCQPPSRSPQAWMAFWDPCHTIPPAQLRLCPGSGFWAACLSGCTAHPSHTTPFCVQPSILVIKQHPSYLLSEGRYRHLGCQSECSRNTFRTLPPHGALARKPLGAGGLQASELLFIPWILRGAQGELMLENACLQIQKSVLRLEKEISIIWYIITRWD